MRKALRSGAPFVLLRRAYRRAAQVPSRSKHTERHGMAGVYLFALHGGDWPRTRWCGAWLRGSASGLQWGL